MPHGYTVDFDDSAMLQYSKQHKNGEETKIKADKVGTQATGGTEWLVNVKDPRKNLRLGRYSTKKDAKKAMKKWMRNNKKGVPGSGKDIFGGSGGIPGMGGSGLF